MIQNLFNVQQKGARSILSSTDREVPSWCLQLRENLCKKKFKYENPIKDTFLL